MAALVCVSVDPEPLYYILGGDAAHHISLLDYAHPSWIGVYKAKDNNLSSKKETEPEVAQTFEMDLGQSYNTVAKLARMDREPNIAVLLAHDSSLEPVLDRLASKDQLIPLSGTRGVLELFKLRERRS